MSKKTNLQIELESALNWLQVYREQDMPPWYPEYKAIRERVRDLKRRIAGKHDV